MTSLPIPAYKWNGRTCYLRRDIEDFIVSQQERYPSVKFPKHWSPKISTWIAQYRRLHPGKKLEKKLSGLNYKAFCRQNNIPVDAQGRQVIFDLNIFFSKATRVGSNWGFIFRDFTKAPSEPQNTLSEAPEGIEGTLGWLQGIKAKAEAAIALKARMAEESARIDNMRAEAARVQAEWEARIQKEEQALAQQSQELEDVVSALKNGKI